MIVNNTTTITKDEAIALLVYETKRTHYRKFVLLSVLFVCGLVILINGLISSVSAYITMGSLFLAICLVYSLMIFVNIKKTTKQVIKNNEEICNNGVTYNYKFKEQSIHVTCLSNNKINKVEYKYDFVKKVTEYKDRYKINLKDHMILFVNKDGFDNKLEEFFIKNLEKNKKKIKYIKKK